VIRTNVLSNAPGLSGDNIRFSNEIEQRCFSMVNVTHDGNNRRAIRQILLAILFNINGFLNIRADKVGLITKFL